MSQSRRRWWRMLLATGCLIALSACNGTVELTGQGDTARDSSTQSDADDTAPGDTSQPSPDTNVPDVAPVPTPSGWSQKLPPLRTAPEVCQPWSDAQAMAAQAFLPASGCDAGILPEDARADAMLRLNFYRWLVGVELTDEAVAALGNVQACAFYQGSNGIQISHNPDTSQPCHSPAASQTAAISNLAGSVSSASDAIDLFTTDTAHRTLILAPGLVETAMGYYEGVACQLVFGDNWVWEEPVHQTIAYPAPGPNPQPPTRLFTVQPATGHDYTPATTASVEVGGTDVGATVTLAETGYGTDVLRIELPDKPPLGTPVEVSVENIDTAAGPVAENYVVRFVSCE